MTSAKVFMNGRSQAIRLPVEFRVSTDEVFLKKTAEGFLVMERDPWELFAEGCRELSENFLADRKQPSLDPKGLGKVIYLLDSDTLIHMIRGLRLALAKNERERQRVQAAGRILNRCRRQQGAGDAVGVSAITVAELEYGARNSEDYAREAAAVRKILMPFVAYDFDAMAAAEHYGEVRHALESASKMIGAMDLLIAGHARALGAVLVTSNTNHFQRVPSLVCENWLL